MRMNEYEEELYWAAGFFDGEGYVATYTRRSKPGSPLYSYMRFGANQVHREPLDRLADALGVGKVSGPHHSPSMKENQKPRYIWQVDSQKEAAQAVRLLLPRVSAIKKAQIELAIAKMETRTSKRYEVS